MKKRKDLKIIISSATLQANEFKDFFDKNNFNEGIIYF
jgi:HrpA-like RNA helicase